jgi:hypothetical protein
MVGVKATVGIVRHLRRLERASCAADIVKELQHLGPSLAQPRFLSETPLPALAALAEAHLRDRLGPARDALTGTLDARAFGDLFMAHARHVSTIGGEAVAVRLTLLDAGDPRSDAAAAAHLRTLAVACATSVAEGDYVGRVDNTALAVLPRHGGLRGARSVAARLVHSCREMFAGKGPLRLEVALESEERTVSECSEVTVGAG